MFLPWKSADLLYVSYVLEVSIQHQEFLRIDYAITVRIDVRGTSHHPHPSLEVPATDDILMTVNTVLS